MLSENKNPYLIETNTIGAYLALAIKLQIYNEQNADKKNEMAKADLGLNFCIQIQETGEMENEGLQFYMALFKNKETNEEEISLAVIGNATETAITKEEIPEGALNATLKPLNNKNLNKLIEKYKN